MAGKDKREHPLLVQKGQEIALTPGSSKSTIRGVLPQDAPQAKFLLPLEEREEKAEKTSHSRPNCV